MKHLPSRFRRLDGALADLPVEHPMLLTELDGFLSGLLVCPEPIPSFEWMTPIWGPETDGIPAFEDPLDVQWFVAAVAARRDEIARDLARGKLQPILDVDDRNGDVLWEEWILGFVAAMAVRPEAWGTLADDPGLSAPWLRLKTLIDVAHGESALDSMQINALQDHAVRDLTEAVQRLYAASVRSAGRAGDASLATPAAKTGRNDPCPCGSGKKHKRCCG